MASFKCFSSWQQRNDKSANADISGHEESANRKFINAIDGFTCPHAKKFSYFGTKNANSGWLQVDLKGFYTLKSVRIPVIVASSFPGLEYRFGNESKADNYESNPVLVANSEEFYTGQILEIYPPVPLVGRYFLIQQNPITDMHITEVQILAE